MSELDHWHPVLLSRELSRSKPRAVTVAGRTLAVFRTTHGVAALDDACPHRGFPLHRGTVEHDALVCPYHGWRWSPDGRGVSPGNPRSKPCATAYECVERHGAVWLRRAGADTAFPYLDVGGHTPVGTAHTRVDAPIEVVLDNFIEVEHTGDVHTFLGYERARMAEVESETTVADDSVRVWNRGPQRPLPSPARRAFGIPREALFVDDWTTRFSPVHSVYEQYFVDARTGERAGDALRIAVFFTPVDDRRTDLAVFAYTQVDRSERPLVEALRLPAVMAFVRWEVSRDAKLLAHMADAPISLRHRALGRFDRALVASRKLLDRIYRGRTDAKLRVVE